MMIWLIEMYRLDEWETYVRLYQADKVSTDSDLCDVPNKRRNARLATNEIIGLALKEYFKPQEEPIEEIEIPIEEEWSEWPDFDEEERFDWSLSLKSISHKYNEQK